MAPAPRLRLIPLQRMYALGPCVRACVSLSLPPRYENNFEHIDDPSSGERGTKRTLSSVFSMWRESKQGPDVDALWADIRALCACTGREMGELLASMGRGAGGGSAHGSPACTRASGQQAAGAGAGAGAGTGTAQLRPEGLWPHTFREPDKQHCFQVRKKHALWCTLVCVVCDTG